jgi:hypothetical protein
MSAVRSMGDGADECIKIAETYEEKCEGKHYCILCGKLANNIPHPLTDSQKIWMGEKESIVDVFLCEYHADKVTASSISRMVRRRLRINRSFRGIRS